ncbi:hypothetical protein OAS50_00755 [Litorivicinus sp.]|nr:hypothetical protein [Litorivicinus sp.]
MNILKSVLWSLTFFPMAVLGQVVGSIFGEILYSVYSAMALALPEFMFVIAPWIIGGLTGGIAAAWIINKYAQPIGLLAVSLLPCLAMLLASVGNLLGYAEHSDLSLLIGQIGANLATLVMFVHQVRERLLEIQFNSDAPSSGDTE